LLPHAHDNCGGDQHAQVANYFQVDFSLFSLGILIDALHITEAEEEYSPRRERFVVKVNNCGHVWRDSPMHKGLDGCDGAAMFSSREYFSPSSVNEELDRMSMIKRELGPSA
jgi:hypothetical protein